MKQVKFELRAPHLHGHFQSPVYNFMYFYLKGAPQIV